MKRGPRCYIGLGSNLDQPSERIHEAAGLIARIEGVSELRLSPLYRSPPWGNTNQPDFVNAVAECRLQFDPRTLLRELLTVEQGMGRVRGGERWGPRRIDLDLLHVDGIRLSVAAADLPAPELPALELPHPRIADRAFVLRPWLDLVDDLELPGIGSLRRLASQMDCSSLSPL